MGRPSTYDSKHCKTVIEVMENGGSQHEVAAAIGISWDTFLQWKGKYEDFAESVDIGSHLSKSWWLEKGRKNLENKDFSYVGWYMQMKNRFGWHDRKSQFSPKNIPGFSKLSLYEKTKVVEELFEEKDMSADEYKTFLEAIRIKADIIMIDDAIQKQNKMNELKGLPKIDLNEPPKL